MLWLYFPHWITYVLMAILIVVSIPLHVKVRREAKMKKIQAHNKARNKFNHNR